MVDVLSLGYFVDVYEVFDIFFEFYKGIVVYYIDNFVFVDCVNWIFFFDIVLWVGEYLFYIECDFLFFVIDIQDYYFDFLID